MAQQNLIMTPITLFEHRDPMSPPTEHGTCTAAVVAQATNPARYKMVCYNDQRTTICAATITGSNEHSLQLSMHTAEYGSFKDDVGTQFNMMFLRSVDVEPFLANLATCFYGASSQPTHTTVVADFAPPDKRTDAGRAKTLELGKRCKVRYTMFECIRAVNPGDVPRLREILETNGDHPYAFDPVQSPFAITADGKGFESSVVGMIEDCSRAVVIPEALARGCQSAILSGKTLVAIVTLHRILHDPTNGIESAAKASSALALVGGNKERHHGAIVPVGPSLTGAAVNAKLQAEGEAQHGGGGLGGGVPAEHMLLVQKMAAQINTAHSQLRDIQDRVDGFQQEWKQSVTRPKPSVLTPSQLEHNVKQLILEHERVQEELQRRDELCTSIDERNRHLQKQVDKAAMVAQTLMDEKKNQASSHNDQRLESDRQQMKLQETLMRQRNERDDLNRHLTTVKKLLDASDTELRDIKGRHEVLKLQIAGTTDKLDAAEDRYRNESSHRKAFEAKVASLQSEIRDGVAEIHLKTAQLEDLRRKADAERVHSMQIMEDERARRAVEAQQLRSEIVDELQQRDEKFQADRARVAEDHWTRGHDEGKELGRRDARMDIETKMTELQLKAQRAKTELEAYKQQQRSAQDDALAENRRMESQVSALKRSVEELTKRKATAEYEMHTLQLKTRNAQDALFLGLTAAAHRLTRPAAPTNVVAMLHAIREGSSLNLTFQHDRLLVEEREAQERRAQWISDEMEAQYSQLLSQTFHQEFANPLVYLHGDLTNNLVALWEARDFDTRRELEETDTLCRGTIATDEDLSFDAIVDFWHQQIEERNAIVSEEGDMRMAFERESVQWLADSYGAIEGMRVELEEQRIALFREEDEGRQVIDHAAVEWQNDAFADVIEMRKQWAAEQDEVIAEEQGPRRAIEEEAEAWQQEAFADVIAMRKRWAEEQQEIIDAEHDARQATDGERDGWFEEAFGFVTAQKEAREALCSEEGAQREAIEGEEAPESKSLYASIEEILLAEVIAAQREVFDEEAAAREAIEAGEEETERADLAQQHSAGQKEVEALLAAREKWLQEQANARESEEHNEAAARDVVLGEQDREHRLLMKDEASQNPKKKAKKERAAKRTSLDPLSGRDDADAAMHGGDADGAGGGGSASPLGGGGGAADDDSTSSSSSDNESMGRFAAQRASMQQNQSARNVPGKGLFKDSDEDSDTGLGQAAVVRAPPKTSSPKKAPAGKRAAASLFDDSSDDEGSAPPAPAPKKAAPKKAPPKGPGGKKSLFDDSDSD